MQYDELTPERKAAIALVAFGADISAELLRSLPQQDMERLTVEIANLGDVPAEIEEKVVDECYEIFMAREYISQGGVDFAKNVLEKRSAWKRPWK